MDYMNNWNWRCPPFSMRYYLMQLMVDFEGCRCVYVLSVNVCKRRMIDKKCETVLIEIESGLYLFSLVYWDWIEGVWMLLKWLKVSACCVWIVCVVQNTCSTNYLWREQKCKKKREKKKVKSNWNANATKMNTN